MKNIVIMTIFLIYFIATIRGIYRVILFKVGLKVPPDIYSTEPNSDEKVDLHIRVFATSTSQTSDPITFDTDGVPFIIDNSETGAIFNDRSLLLVNLALIMSLLKPQMVYPQKGDL